MEILFGVGRRWRLCRLVLALFLFAFLLLVLQVLHEHERDHAQQTADCDPKDAALFWQRNRIRNERKSFALAHSPSWKRAALISSRVGRASNLAAARL